MQREFIEEMDLKVEVLDHLYTTDYFQESAFLPGDQIISIYYFVKPLEEIKTSMSDKEFDFTKDQMKLYKDRTEIEAFRFIDLEKFSEGAVTLPIDKIVAGMIMAI